MCGLKDLESFTHGGGASSITYFGLYALRKLISAWPKLRTLYISGDMRGDEKQEALLPNLPPTTCALESVTFERCIPSDFDLFAPMFADSSQSLRKFEAWTSGHKEMDAIFMNILPAIETIKLGGSSHPSPQFIIEHLAHAPKLTTISIGCEYDHEGNIRRAFATALVQPDSFPALRSLGYPGQSGTYKTGRGRNVREHEYENPGQEELLKAARERNIHAYIASDLEYKAEGAQRRAGIIAARRRGW
ncbi:hypothetical protein Hypma_013373 [Hypsizygus marmoreus]|uniref:Uncharacterized protein n=1 Tax=Hypsizygus marmoreus TaxID=39966 RepID=A0A369JIM2_HYPMA|nr:hypothetical protein Hypma_013373 [Hypsizygus marmoreus]